MYSSIQKKMCKCGCGKMPSLGYGGFRFSCAPQEILDKVGSKKEVARKNKNNRLALGRKLQTVQNVVSGAEMNRWFENRRKEMTGVCANCRNKSCKDSDEFYKFSICHILPKAYFGSIKTHEKNWLELCFWGEKSCHSNLDNRMIDLINMACWDEIVTKFVAMYPEIAENEKKRIPQVLLNYIQTEL